MRGRLFAAAVSGLLTLPTAGCAASDTATDTRPEARPAVGVCQGLDDCRVVARTDVDGDGVRDQVGFVVVSEDRVVVRVRTPEGRTLRRGLDTVWFPEGELFGAAPIDGRPGAELVVGTTMGAHTLFFTVLTVRAGGLGRLEAPDDEDEWMVDGAYSLHAGITRRVEDGRAVVVLEHASRDGSAPRFSGTRRVYAWSADGWRHLRTERTRYRGEQSVTDIAGWHVSGLPRLPEF